VISDLYLAHGCGAGDRHAVAACDALLVREAGYAAAAARIDAAVRDEAIQVVRTNAFSPRGDRPAAICDYEGRGALHAWLRVLVAREMVKRAGAQQRAVPLEDRLLDTPAVNDDPVMEELKLKYRAELAEAFRAALEDLSSRDRTLLRYQLIDGLTIDDIGKLHRVHRATAARWLAAIRDGLVERTRTLLADSLGVDTVEAASIIRMVQSQLDVSVIRHLQPKRKR
jgi:RNA polymerase sigma-70 factor, ECF subfamily